MRQRRLKNEINVVPYIDVMLVLLVIFMVATPMMTTGSVDLPASGTAPGSRTNTSRCEIKPDGRLSVFNTRARKPRRAACARCAASWSN
jgi:biopolymer transport protein TolR